MREFFLRLIKAILDWLLGILGRHGGSQAELISLSTLPTTFGRETQDGQTVNVQVIQYTNSKGQVFGITLKSLDDPANNSIADYLQQAKVWFSAEINPQNPPSVPKITANVLFLEVLSGFLDANLTDLNALELANRLRQREFSTASMKLVMDKCNERVSSLENVATITHPEGQAIAVQLDEIGAHLPDLMSMKAPTADFLEIVVDWKNVPREATSYRIDYAVDPRFSGTHSYRLSGKTTYAQAKVQALDNAITVRLSNSVWSSPSKSAGTTPGASKVVDVSKSSSSPVDWRTQVAGNATYDLNGSWWIKFS
jgi:hypothetical protein